MKTFEIDKKAVGVGMVKVIVNIKNSTDETVIMKIQDKEYEAELGTSEIRFKGGNKDILVNGNKASVSGFKVDIADEIRAEVEKQQTERFMEEEHQISHYFGRGYTLIGMYDKYSQAALKIVYDKFKVINKDADMYEDTPYTFPKMTGRELLEELDAAVEELNRKNEAANEQENEEVQSKIEEAKRTGKPVLIKKESEMDIDNFDEGHAKAIYTYAMPDGSIREEEKIEIWD